MRTRLIVGAIALAAVTTTACASDEIGPKATPADELMTVESEFGEVEVPKEPTAALGMYTTDVDILLTLGIELADSQPIRGDSGYTTFPEFFPADALEGVDAFANYPDYDYDAILKAQPDFILNGLGYDKKVNRRLPDIAPTYSVNAFDGRSWTEHFKETAIALDREAEYDAWIEKYDARVAEVRAAIEEAGAEDLMMAPLGYYEGEAVVSCYSGVECQAFEDLGLGVFEPGRANDNEGTTYSAERIGELAEVDFAFVTVASTEEGQEQFETIMDEAGKNPLWANLDMVKNDRVIPFDLEMTFGSPSGQMAFLDVVEDAVTGGSA